MYQNLVHVLKDLSIQFQSPTEHLEQNNMTKRKQILYKAKYNFFISHDKALLHVLNSSFHRFLLLKIISIHLLCFYLQWQDDSETYVNGLIWEFDVLSVAYDVAQKTPNKNTPVAGVAEELLQVSATNSDCECVGASMQVPLASSTCAKVDESNEECVFSDESDEVNDSDANEGDACTKEEQSQKLHSERFKLTGCNKEERYQNALERLRECMLEARATGIVPNDVTDVKV